MVPEPHYNDELKAHADALVEKVWKDGAGSHDALQARVLCPHAFLDTA